MSGRERDMQSLAFSTLWDVIEMLAYANGFNHPDTLRKVRDARKEFFKAMFGDEAENYGWRRKDGGA